MYFTARRANSTGGMINAGDQDYLEDIYKAVWNNETKQWDSITNNLPRLNTTGHDALNWISPDGLTAVVTWNNAMTEDKNQTKSSDICEVEYTKKSSWTAPRIIVNKSINTSFFEGSATLTADGNTMYFVSDRKGEKKSTDIYVVEKRGNTWGEAVALPDSINSVGRETTPFISGDGRYLFFSSDGHTGMGGLDIFVCERTEKGWSKPVNLGPSVNTVNDETHFSINFSSKKAYCAGVELIGLKSNYNCFSFDLNTLQLPFKW
jgi:Tol biopolymer transport system component